MTTLLKERLRRYRPGIIAVAANMHELDRAWSLLELTDEEQERWELIADPTAVPMRIELIPKKALKDFATPELKGIWMKYNGKRTGGIYIDSYRD